MQPRDTTPLSLSLSLCSCALSMPAFAADVAIHEELSSYSANGGTLTVTFGLNTMTDGVGLIVIAAAEGTDNNRDVTSVTLDSSSATDLSFIEIGRIDGDDAGGGGQNQQLTVWKLDNRAFGSTSETLYGEVDIAFSANASARYVFVYAVTGQMPDDLVRNWEELARNDTTGDHDITDFVLEPDAIIISAHLWSDSSTPTVTPAEDSDWNQNNTTTGLCIQHAVPNDAANKTMTVTFTNLAGGNISADTLNAAVVIRSDDDIIHTPAGAPATLGGTGTGEYWLEGLTAQTGASGSVGDRGDITDWGISSTYREKATWLNSDICDGKASTDYRKITYLASPGNNEINIMAFSPLAADREAVFDMYLAGVESELADAVGTNGTHRHIGASLNNWGDYAGLVVWDLERFCLHYDGNETSGTGWGGMNVYDPDAQNDPEWEYNAATRYYWERVHQWFVEIKAPNVEALVFYHHPQQPRSRSEGLNSNWAGHGWQGDIHWVFKMQGAFDGHCYPMIALSDSEIETWVTNVLDNFRLIDVALSDVFCYVTHWPSRPGIEAYQDNTAVAEIIDGVDGFRTTWSNFDAMYLGVVGLGAEWDDSFEIASVDELNSSVTIADEVAHLFDPADPTVQISGSDSNDGTYNFGSVGEVDPNTIVYFSPPPFIPGSTTPLGNLITPAKTVQDFVDWWEDVFEDEWDLHF